MLRAFVIGVLLSPLALLLLGLIGNHLQLFRWLAIGALVVLALLLVAGLYQAFIDAVDAPGGDDQI
jgi:hypothetical protein